MQKSLSLACSILLSISIVSCVHFTANPFPSVLEKEMQQTPSFRELPNDDGFIFGYQFSQVLTDKESASLLMDIISIIENNDISVKNKVVVFAYDTKEKCVIVTADFVSNEVEFWETKNLVDYSKKIFVGDPEQILTNIIDDNVLLPMTVETGKIIDEIRRMTGYRTDCTDNGCV